MSVYKMEDGTIVDTDKAQALWEESTRWNGRNHISNATGSQFNHETLYKSRKGRYYVEKTSQWEGATPSAEWLSDEEAARWLLANDHKLPKGLEALEDDVSE